MNLNAGSSNHGGNGAGRANGIDALDPLADGEEERTMPLSFEDGAESLSVAGGGSRRRFGFGTLAFAGAAAVAVASLFSMRAIGRAGASDAPTSDAGLLVESFLKEQAARKGDAAKSDALLGAENYAHLQISRDDLQKNPFVLLAEEPKIEGVEPGDATPARVVAEDPRVARVAEWEQAVVASYEQVKVQSTMLSSRADACLATINSQVYRTGDAVLVPKATVRLTVHLIEADGVTLRAFDAALGCEKLQKFLVKRSF
jgi:hypothetical protein